MPKPAVLRGDARNLPLPDESADLIVTSPPYFALRSYSDGGEHYEGQIGSEATPAEYLEALWACTAEWVRVLKPAGSIFVNLGDKYSQRVATRPSSHQDGLFPDRPELRKDWKRDRALGLARMPYENVIDEGGNYVREKSLMGLPWRYAIGCMDRLGLILRAEIIWDKPNCLSGGTMVYAKVKGRPTTIKVHDLCRAYAPDQVQLWNGQRWTQVLWWQPVGRHPDAAQSMTAIRAARKRGDEPVIGGDIEIELRSGERIGCTREHRWTTQRGLVQAADLVAGDVLNTCPMPEGETAPAALDDEMVGWFVGLYIAEGSHGSDRTIQMSGHVKEAERYKRLCELAGAFHGTCAVYATGGNSATINLTGRFLDAIIETYVGGRTATDKHLRPACWQRSNRFLGAVLNGYLSGDGHWREDALRWIVGFTDNDTLAADLRALGGRLGLSVRLARCTHTGFGREWPGWRGSITEPERRRQPDSQIVAIRQSRARQFWDIGVEDEPHLFALASGVLTHNSLPESVQDRVRRSHEQVFHFTRQPRYYAAVDEIREPHQPQSVARTRRNRFAPDLSQNGVGSPNTLNPSDACNPLGKLPGSVWEIPSAPLVVPARVGVDHFAAFPPELVRRIVLGWSPAGICEACGEARRPVVHAEPVKSPKHASGSIMGSRRSTGDIRGWDGLPRFNMTRALTGYACACTLYTDHPGTGEPTQRRDYSPGIRDDHAQGTYGRKQAGEYERVGPWREYHFESWTPPPARPALVVDPFGGTGTTALVASVLGRTGVTVDRSGDYCRLAAWRVADPGERARALGVPKPPPVPDGQQSLFDEVDPASW